MIQLTRLNTQPIVLNSDLIKLIEYTPDTVITLVSGDKFVVRETGTQILERIVEFRRRVLEGLPLNFSGWTAPTIETHDAEPSDSSSEEV